LNVALPVAAAQPQNPSTRLPGETPDQAEILRAIEAVKSDPNLATERTIKTLRWKRPTNERASKAPVWVAWIAGLFWWIEESARVLVWGIAILLFGFMAAFVVRAVRRHGSAESVTEAFTAPTHVRDLDIRPESLPDDIGAAARARWERGEHRLALALLYQGLLSRLAHVHRIAIRESSTEGECLALAAHRLRHESYLYASRLVAVWQGAVYGSEVVQPAAVYALCDGFASALGAGGPSERAAEAAK
jgi:hypothetical protein